MNVKPFSIALMCALAVGFSAALAPNAAFADRGYRDDGFRDRGVVSTDRRAIRTERRVVRRDRGRDVVVVNPRPRTVVVRPRSRVLVVEPPRYRHRHRLVPAPVYDYYYPRYPYYGDSLGLGLHITPYGTYLDLGAGFRID